jgi:two-component system response regulator YesN
MNHYEKALLFYAIQNIAEELLHDACLVGFSYHPNQMLWFLQPKSADGERDWQDLNDTLRDSVGSIQSVSKSLLKLPVSLFLSSGYVSWEETGSQFIKLKALQSRGIGQNKEIVLYDAAAPEFGGGFDHDRMHKSAQFQKKLKLLETYLESGQDEEFALLYADLSACARSLSPFSPQQLHHAVTAMLLGYMSACGMTEDIASKMDLQRMLEDSSRMTWDEKNADLLQLAHCIFEQKSKEQTNKSVETVEHLKQFIHEELDKELSLTRLSEVVHMNTSYLSRFFKQMTGSSLTEYIMDLRIAKAKTLLRETDLKIQDIAGKVGFDAPAYFIRLFKKETNLTPMEYRESRVN